MQATITHGCQRFEANLSEPLDISLPLDAEGKGVNAFHAPPFAVSPVRSGSFTGSIREGGSLNFLDVRLNPHGNGTHTECVGHIADGYTINQCLRKFFFLAELISVSPVRQAGGDEVILREQVEAALAGKNPEALIIRTLPHDAGKAAKNYSGTNPPYPLPGVASLLVEKNIRHVLLDLPSADREEDSGNLLFHKTFWNLPGPVRKDATITELVYAPAEIEDGTYLLNLQIASFELDASPSKPVLFRLKIVSR